MTAPNRTPAAVPVTATSLAKENAEAGGGSTSREMMAASAERLAQRQGLSVGDMSAAMAAKKNLHMIAAKMSEMNWGKGLDDMTRRAVAAYLERNRLDLTEVDVLGGNLYRNARYFKRRLAEMVEDGRVEYLKSDWVHKDARLDAHNDEWSTNEKTRRERVRIEYGIPDAAVGACVFRVKVRGVDMEITAAKWCGGGTRQRDPVGDQFPIESSETRACRRCMTLVASSIPALKWREDDLDDEGVDLSHVIKDARAASDAQEVFAPSKQIATPDYGTDAGGPLTPKELTDEESLAYDRELYAAENK